MASATAPAASSTLNVDKVQAALRIVEEAQSLLRFACCELSSVPHFFPDYARLLRLEEKVHDEWKHLDDALAAKRSKL